MRYRDLNDCGKLCFSMIVANIPEQLYSSSIAVNGMGHCIDFFLKSKERCDFDFKRLPQKFDLMAFLFECHLYLDVIS